MKLTKLLRSLLPGTADPETTDAPGVLDSDGFRQALHKSRCRADRCNHPFSVIRFEIEGGLTGDGRQRLLQALRSRVRDSDEMGWWDERALGVILYGTPLPQARTLAEEVLGRQEAPGGVVYSVYAYPDGQRPQADGAAQPERDREMPAACRLETDDCLPIFAVPYPWWKRALDVTGALVALTLASPLMLLTALWIRLVSPGPIFFRQERVGRGGSRFTLFKFRTMTHGADARAHKEYLATLIGEGDAPMVKQDSGNRQIIPLGRLLRRLAVDELPQLLNVLRGEMSLVGPRPPIGYEVDEYACWFKGRLDCVPGMTGLWQVSGKNRLSFKEMVRLDIAYAKKFSFWLDLLILVRTPMAIARQLMDSLASNTLNAAKRTT